MQHAPVSVTPYCGQDQPVRIMIPATIAYRMEREEGPWSMLPYASLYPPDTQQPGMAQVPPPVYKTDLFSAQQTWPL